jgi:TPR repeat protein
MIGSSATLTWPTRNAVNGLCYASGEIRCFARAPMESASSRPVAELVQPRSFGVKHPNGTPMQAFRAGFRAGVRQGLVDGRAPSDPATRLPPANLRRLLAWATIGADQDNGIWCLYGARLGCTMAHIDRFDPLLLLRPDWIERLWLGRIATSFAGREVVCPHTGHGWDRARLADAVRDLGEKLRQGLGLEIVDLDAEQSRFFRSVGSRDFDASAFDRLGNLYRDGSILPESPTKAAKSYAIGAVLGSSNAANNLARLHLQGRGVPKDTEAAIALLSQATGMGSPHAPYHLARVHLNGAPSARIAAQAADLLQLACKRGFTTAHAALAELYRSGRGVPRNPETALMEALLAGDEGAAIAETLRQELDAAQVSRAEDRAGNRQAKPRTE